MSVKTLFEQENNLVRITYTGEMSPADVLQSSLEMQQHPEYRPGMHSLSDFSNMHFVDIDFDKVHEYSAYMPDIEQTRGSCRWAMASSNATNFGILRMFEMLNDNSPIEMKVFTNVEDGRKWLQKAGS